MVVVVMVVVVVADINWLNYCVCGFKESDNLWWDAFATEFFEDDAMLTLSFSMEDGPKRYSEFNSLFLLCNILRIVWNSCFLIKVELEVKLYRTEMRMIMIFMRWTHIREFKKRSVGI